jgi:hypothetical protein
MGASTRGEGPRTRPLVADPVSIEAVGTSPRALMSVRHSGGQKDTLLIRCFGWALLTGTASGGSLMLWSEVESWISGGTFDLIFVTLGVVFGTLFAVPFGLVTSLVVVDVLRRGLRSDDPDRAVKVVLSGILGSLNLVVLLAAALKAGDLDLGNWLVLGSCLLAADLGAGAVLALAGRSFLRYGSVLRGDR